MDISEVARLSGLPASTLRYYEEKGLIRSTGRRGLHRLFNASVMERLALIALGRAAGFSLNEIRTMLGAGNVTDFNRQMLLDKAAELDRAIKQLTAARDGLRHAAQCSAASHLQCPKFRRLMTLALENNKRLERSTSRSGKRKIGKGRVA